MEKDRLREDLLRLREELDRSDSLDPDARARLAEIAADIESLLESEESGEHESLADRLRSAADHFEESHPTLTAAVGRIADALSAIGI
ncbi:MAG: DUF4404 family protein [Myxococcota bacterium]|nr:DUF4404 family protein [Myxococcota bacterium]